MMKKTNVKKFTVSALLGVLLCFGCFFGIFGVSNKAYAAASETTKTWEIDTSFRTRVTTELSKATDFKGGTIEFDLIDTDLKDDYNINGVCSSMGNHQVGVAYHNFNGGTAGGDAKWNTRRLNYAGIHFSFFKKHVDMNDFSWRVGGINDSENNNPTESQLSSFSYFADGRIVEYSGATGLSSGGTMRWQRVITPSTDGFVGTQEDIDFFMTSGYSYRVQWVWGNVGADKTVTAYTPEQMNGLGVNARHGWYVAYFKPISAPESDYKVLFAFRTRAVYRLQDQIDGDNCTYAGFEISSNHGNPRQYNNGEYSPASHNVKTELDNVAIYDGYEYTTSEKKAKSDFESSYTGLTGLDGSNIKNAGRVNSDVGAWAGDFKSASWDKHDTTVDGLRVQITNAGKECIETYATSELKDRTVRTVSFTDGENTLFTQKVIDGFAATMPDNRVNGKFYRWVIPTGVDLQSVTQDVTIVGTATDKRYITYDSNGGTGEIARVEETVGTALTLSDGSGYARDTYRLIGWSTHKNGETEFDLSGDYTITDDDITLYAVWELVTYKTTFKLPDGTVLAENETTHGYNAFYDGKIPVIDGKTFIGWDKSVNGITAETDFIATFADGWDEFADNKTVSVNFGAAVTKTETVAFYRKLPENGGIKIRLDISEISGFGKVSVLLGGSDAKGTDASEIDVTAYAKNYTTVLVETDAYAYKISEKPLDGSEEEFELKTKKNILRSVGGGYFGVSFVTASTNFA